MSIWDAAGDAVKSIAEANILPIAIGANLADIADDPVAAITNIGGVLSPSLGFVTTLPQMFSTEPNIAGAGGLPVFAAALALLKDMRDQCGEGEPDQGGSFATGKNQCDLIADMMGSATSPPSWQGAASKAYVAANDRQRKRMTDVANTDAMVHKTLATEAAAVADTRSTLDSCIRTINAAIPVATAIAATKVGNAASYGFQIQLSEPVMLMAHTSFRGLVDSVPDKATAIKSASASYGAAGSAEYGGGSPSAPAASTLKVVTADLRRKAGDQRVVAGQVTAASQTTEGTAANVSKTHGTVCTSTATALGTAAASRASTLAVISKSGEKLAEGLERAAFHYDAADQGGARKLETELHPR